MYVYSNVCRLLKVLIMELNKLCVRRFNKNERQLSTVDYGAENKNTDDRRKIAC